MGRSSRNPKICCKWTDRISSLPDDVLHNILSYLPILEVVQLSVLSKRWKYLWTTLPYLLIDIQDLYPDGFTEDHDLAMIEKCKDFINWILISQSATKLVSFFFCCGDVFSKDAVLRWIHAITRRNVQQLVLDFYLDEPFELPYCVATCESLRVLKLRLSSGILKLPNHVGFRQLKLLHLEQVELSDQHLTNCLFSKCHLLEKLILESCSLGALTLLDIASTSLTYIVIRNFDYQERYDICEIKIICPNLKFLKYEAPMPKDIIFVDLLSIDAVRISPTFGESDEKTGILVHKMIKGVTSTSFLKLGSPSILGLYIAARKARLCPVSLYALKSLELGMQCDRDFVEVMTLLLKYSPNLEVLKLHSYGGRDWSNNWQLHDPDKSIACLESHLKSVKLTGFGGQENDTELLRFFLKNARVLEKLTIVWFCNAYQSEEASEKILRFPRTSPHVVVTFLNDKPRTNPLFFGDQWYDRYKE